MRRQIMWSLTMYSGVASIGWAGGAKAEQLIPKLADSAPPSRDSATAETDLAPTQPVPATPPAPSDGRPAIAATPTMLLLLPWRVKVDEDRLHRKLLRAADRMLAGTSRYLERDAGEPAPPRVVIVYSSALMAYHQADVLVKVSLDRVTADEASASSEVTAKLSYVLECRTTDYGRMVPWAAGTVEASKSPFRQIGAADAVWGSDPGEAAFSLSSAQAPGRTTVRNFQYVHPIADLRAEAIEDAIVCIVGDIGEVEFQPSLNADLATLGLSVDFLQTPRARRRGRPSDGAVGRQISDVRLSGDNVILEVELHNPLPTLRVGGRVEFQVDADSGARGRAALVRSAPFLLAPHETRRVSVTIPAARVGVPPEAKGGRPVGALMSLERGTQCFVEGVRLLSFRSAAGLLAEGVDERRELATQ